MGELRIEEEKFYRTRDGRKLGPTKPYQSIAPDGPYAECHWEAGPYVYQDDGTFWNNANPRNDLVAEWHLSTAVEPTGPVRTVTRKEIVEGEYGRIRVLPLAGVSDKHVGVRFTSGDVPLASLNAAELRAAAAVLIELADALTQHVGAGE